MNQQYFTIEEDYSEHEFVKYLEENPLVYQEFERLCWNEIETGLKRTSAMMLIAIIRWKTRIRELNSDFKISNRWAKPLAMLFLEKEGHKIPELVATFFDFRERPQEHYQNIILKTAIQWYVINRTN